MNKLHYVERIEFKENQLYLMVDGKVYNFPLDKISRKLLNASQLEREKYEISASGYGIHWPLVDEDLSIDGLLGLKHVPAQKKKETII